MTERAGTVTVTEVGPRDGLQNEQRTLSVEERIELVDRLSASGLSRIEAVSFVHPRLVPQMADAEAVMAGINRRDGTVYAGLVLNDRGAERAIDAGVDEIHYAMVASESFNLRNQGCSVSESMLEFRQIAERVADADLPLTAIVGAAFGCPFEGLVDPVHAQGLAEELARAGAGRIVLSDTIGVAVPTAVSSLVTQVKETLDERITVGVHLHNTRNTGMANAYAAIQAGATTLDASVGGAGGCPFAPNATGNISTEDLLYMLRGMDCGDQVDIASVIDTARWLEDVLGHELPGMVMKAGLFPEVVGPHS